MKKQTYHHIIAQERDLIAVWKTSGVSYREIARRLNRSPSSIHEEVKRNRLKGKCYVAICAQVKASERKTLARRRHPLKSPWVYAYVLKKLKEGWSPEQISGRLKKDYPDDKNKQVSYETIYQFIYQPDNRDKNLWEYLPWKRKRRKRKRGRNVHRSRIPDRVSIHQRPEEANQRAEFGHWEGDSVIGKRTGKSMHTEVERKTRLLEAELINSLGADDTIKAQEKIFDTIPIQARKSTTLDNGKEFVKHGKLKQQFEMATYFADPYSSWQRGTNEYHNGLLRRYLPKSQEFNLDQKELDDIVKEINNRPRKCLKYQTPKEAFDQELKTAGVRVQG